VTENGQGRLDRNRPRKHLERARVVLASTPGVPVQHVAVEVGVSRPMALAAAFAEAGVDWLLRHKTRKPARSRSSPRRRRAWSR
jgi:hypothetical protein